MKGISKDCDKPAKGRRIARPSSNVGTLKLGKIPQKSPALVDRKSSVSWFLIDMN